jgi:hypothetical protein
MCDGTCSINGCEDEVTRRLCDEHWQLIVDNRGEAGALGRFFRNIISFDDCWIWHSCSTGKGYGEFLDHRAHIWSYLTFVGEYDRSLDLDHTCHNADKSCKGGPSCLHRRCVNPRHLEPVTRSENTKRGRIGDKGKNRTHCKNGHELTPEILILQKGSGRWSCRTCKNRSEAIRLQRQRRAAGIPSRPKRAKYIDDAA